MASQVKIPNLILISSKPSNIISFDDLNILSTIDYKIAGFKVGISKNKICGISFLYQKMNGSGKAFYGCDNQRRTSYDIQSHEFYIDCDDFIQIIYGCYQDGLTQLGVIIYKGKQIVFGSDKGQKFKYLFMGFTFTAAYGNYKQEGLFESLGFRITKLPKQFLQSFFSPLADLLYPENIIQRGGNQQYREPNQQQCNEITSNQQENLPLCNTSQTQQIELNQNAYIQNSRDLNYNAQKYGVQGMAVIQTEIKKDQIQQQQYSKKQNDDDDGIQINNIPEKLFILLIVCVLVSVCYNKIAGKKNKKEKKR